MEIRAANSDPSKSWKSGLFEHSDMSFEELSDYYGIKPIDVDKIKADIDKFNQKKGFKLDDYNDDNDTFIAKKVKAASATPILYDYRAYSLAPRNQGSCSSCWAFATMGQLENFYWKKHGSSAGAVNQYLSVQQLVDCDTTSSGCNYGYPSMAMYYLQSYPAMIDSSYAYTGVTGNCKYNAGGASKVQVTGVNYGGTYYYPWYPIYIAGLLANGPVVVLIGVNAAFTNYSSGIFSAACASGVNHSVLVVGYGYDTPSNTYYYIVRNSWGATWGEAGYIRIKDDGVACSIPMYNYQASIA